MGSVTLVGALPAHLHCPPLYHSLPSEKSTFKIPGFIAQTPARFCAGWFCPSISIASPCGDLWQWFAEAG
jgi:hypothetical protein